MTGYGGFSAEVIRHAARQACDSFHGDPVAMRYDSDTAEIMFNRSIANMMGASDYRQWIDRVFDDPALATVPGDAIEALMAVVYAHITKALGISA